MTHKERLLTALNHEEPDRVPLCATYTPEAEEMMLRHLGVKADEAWPDKAAGGPLPILMDHDALIYWIGPATSYYADRAEEYTDEWGIRWRWFKTPARGSYTEMVNHPLADLEDASRFAMPDFSREDRYDSARRLIKEYGREYGIIGAVPCSLFEVSWYLRGMEKVLMDMVSNKDFLHAYLDRLMTWVDTAGSKLVQLGVDIIYIGDDFGAQDRMLISPQFFREFFKPRYARLFQKWRAINPRVKTAFHSDGNIRPIIGDLIEIGLDILNPVQPKSMDPAELKKQFGEHLAFWGTVDIQEVLPFGTVEDVVQEVRRRIRTVGQHGGLLIAPTHNIQSDVPVQNILAFYESAKTQGRYPLGDN
jgi:uroporphyrinogen decarboxylase